MKFKSFLCMAAAGLMLASCQNNSATGAGSASEAAKADSLMYYFGQFRGIEYKRTAETDTTLSSEDARHEYLRGVQAGLNAVKAGNEAYNQGVSLGMQMAMNMAQFSDDYGVKLSNRGFLKGLREALESDSVADQNEMQKEFYRILGEFNTAKENRDKEAATAALVKEAGAKKLSKITDNLYGSVGNAQGEKLKAGDKVVPEDQDHHCRRQGGERSASGSDTGEGEIRRQSAERCPSFALIRADRHFHDHGASPFRPAFVAAQPQA